MACHHHLCYIFWHDFSCGWNIKTKGVTYKTPHIELIIYPTINIRYVLIRIKLHCHILPVPGHILRHIIDVEVCGGVLIICLLQEKSTL